MAPRRFQSRPAGVKQKDMTLRQWVAEYFREENGEQVVRRHELARVLLNYDMNLHERKWWVRLWRKIQRYYVTSASAPLAEKKE